MNIGEIYMGYFDFNLLKRSLYVGILFALFILISKNIGTGSLVLLFPKYAMIGLPIFAAMMSYLISFQKNLMAIWIYFILLYGATAYIKLMTGAVIRSNEVSSQ